MAEQKNISSNKYALNRKEDSWRKILVLLVLMVFLGIILPMRFFVFVPLMIMHVLLSYARNRFNFGFLGIELIMLNTVLAGILLGAVGGIVVAVLCVVINYVFSRKYMRFFFITLPLYALIGALSSFFLPGSIVSAGIIFTLAYSILSFVLSFTMGAKPFGIFIFTASNIIFNILLFLRFGSWLSSLFGA